MNKTENNMTKTTTVWDLGDHYQRKLISPFKTKNYLVKVPTSKYEHYEATIFENFMEWGLKGGISICVDPQGYI